MQISLIQVEREQALDVSHRYSLKYRYIVQSYKGRTQSLVAEKTNTSENRASRNFDLMIINASLNTAVQSLVINVIWTLLKENTSGPNSEFKKPAMNSPFKAGIQKLSSLANKTAT
ncbi:hypothetical protein Tco_0429635 [Tanacetum coccineum]